MFDGFLDLDLASDTDVGSAFEHVARFYFTVARERMNLDSTLVPPTPPFYHQSILHETLLRLKEDLLRHNTKPNEFKQAGYLTFWVRKLKPFRHYPIFGQTFTNEVLGLKFGLSTVAAVHPHIIAKVSKNKRLWQEWLYDLRYRPVSGHELTKQFEMLSII